MNPPNARARVSGDEIHKLQQQNLNISQELPLVQQQVEQAKILQDRLLQAQVDLAYLESHWLWRMWRWGSNHWRKGIVIVLMLLMVLGGGFAYRRRQQSVMAFSPALLPQPLSLFTFSTQFQLPSSAVTASIPFEYQVKPPNFQGNRSLQTIVDELVSLARQKGMPTHALSITLLDVNTQTVAGYRENELRYPASVMKLFLMVAVYGKVAQGATEEEFTEDLYRMIRHSDNDATSRIMDAVTGTESGSFLQGEAYNAWQEKRQQMNTFFHKAGYTDLYVAQKTYPFGGYASPRGRDWQLQTYAPTFVRNNVTTRHATRLMYEIVTRQAISPEASEKMEILLTRDLAPQAWKYMESGYWRFNPVWGFLGEGLPQEVHFASKAGLTSTRRAEVAYIQSPDGKTRYILAVFGESPAYANSGGLFPQMSRLVYEQLSGKGRGQRAEGRS